MHIGQLIKQELTTQGRSVAWFAERLSYSQTCVCKLFDNDSINTGLLLLISNVLGVDFFKFYSEEFKKAMSEE